MFRKVITALLVGLYLGALIIGDFNPFQATYLLINDILLVALFDGSHLRILAFAFLLGSLMKVISSSGGATGMAHAFIRFATTRRKGQLTAWVLGIIFFFDDYANTLVVGSSMRSVFDRLRISREKLSFIVDATAAPVVSLAPVSTWIIVEVGYIADQCKALSIGSDAYSIFLQTIPYRFYSILMLAFGLIIAISGRDFGTMAIAEQKAHSLAAPHSEDHGDNAPTLDGSPPKGGLWMAVAPILVVIISLGLGLWYSGYRGLIDARTQIMADKQKAQITLIQAKTSGNDRIRQDAQTKIAKADQKLHQLKPSAKNILGYASSSKALLLAALFGGLLAIFMAVRRKSLSLKQAIHVWYKGGLSMTSVLLILLFAWSLGLVCQKLQTAKFLVNLLGGDFEAGFLPVAIFLISSVVSFATGTSWGTMGLIFPLAVSLAHRLSPGNEAFLLASIAAILSGSVFGDHCSPISDTTIMSAMASSCDQIAHVRTQLPYAILVAAVSMITGSLPNGMGIYNPWMGLLIGVVILAILIRIMGKTPCQNPKG